jgi:hypothetical protein
MMVVSLLVFFDVLVISIVVLVMAISIWVTLTAV